MTALTRTSTNVNYLQSSKFILSFDRIPTVQYFCQEVNLPGVSMGKAPINTPTLDIFSPGNKLTYGSLDITFTIDENLTAWIELYNWFLSMASPSSAQRASLSSQQTTKNIGKQAFSEATLTLLTGLNNNNIKVQFHNVFPTSLSDLQFSTQNSSDTIITASSSFNYDYFTFINA